MAQALNRSASHPLDKKWYPLVLDIVQPKRPLPTATCLNQKTVLPLPFSEVIHIPPLYPMAGYEPIQSQKENKVEKLKAAFCSLLQVSNMVASFPVRFSIEEENSSQKE